MTKIDKSLEYLLVGLISGFLIGRAVGGNGWTSLLILIILIILSIALIIKDHYAKS